MCDDDEFNAKYGEQHASLHSPTGVRVGHVTLAGPELTIEAGGKLFTFEWHSYCGPIPLNKRGDPKELGERSPFWQAITFWIEQGKRLDENRRAIWEEPPKEDLTRTHVKIGRHWYPKETVERLMGEPDESAPPGEGVESKP